MSDITSPRLESLASRVEVGVLTKANPDPGLLGVARILIQRTTSLRDVLIRSKRDVWSADQLASELFGALSSYFGDPVPEDPENVRAVSVYLADEYVQLGDSLLLISPQTGRAIARLREEDVYQPAQVAREDGRMVTPGRRIRPEIESFVVQWQFDRASEQETKQGLATKLSQTPLLRETSDPRVLFVTRQGRKTLASQIQAQLHTLLPDRCGGATRTLFEYIQVITEAPSDSRFVCLGEMTAQAFATYPLQDKKAKNLRHDLGASILATTTAGWGRSLAEFIMASCPDLGERRKMTVSELQANLGIGLWVGAPNVVCALLANHPRRDVLPVDVKEDLVLGFSEPCGYLLVDESSYTLKDREIFDRWGVSASLRATVWVDWSRLSMYEVTGIFPKALIAEVVD